MNSGPDLTSQLLKTKAGKQLGESSGTRQSEGTESHCGKASTSVSLLSLHNSLGIVYDCYSHPRKLRQQMKRLAQDHLKCKGQRLATNLGNEALATDPK